MSDLFGNHIVGFPTIGKFCALRSIYVLGKSRDCYNKIVQIRYEPLRGKTNNVVSEQVRHKPGCTSTEKS